jgi:diguanylate cyclase (GGDEF)-like protein/PAS domain S-box-containing protein
MSNALRIIIVDDSVADAELILHEISKSYTPEHAIVDNAEDLKKAFIDKAWDIILCDYSIQDFNPHQALDIAREYDLDIPLIVIAGTIGEEKAVELIKAGCGDCILKSNMTRLPGVIDREIKEAQVRKENRALNRSLQKYQLLADEASDIILFIDSKGNILDANQSAIKIYGYSFEELLKINIADLRRDDDMDFVEAQIKKAAEKGMRFEAVHYRKDGSSFYAEVSSQGALLEGKKILISIIRDITERKQMEATLRESEEKFRYLFDHSLVGKSLTLPSGEMQVNRALCEMLGYSAEELQGKKWEEITHPDDIEYTRREIGELLSGNKSMMRFNQRYIKRDGHIVWADVLSSIRRDTSGKPLYFITSIIDITAQKKIQEALTASENMYRTFVNASQDMIFLKDDQFRHIVANKNLAAFFNQSESEIVGKTDDELMPKAAAAQCRKADRLALTKKAAVTLEETVGDRVFESVKFPVELMNNQWGVGGIIRDITERKRAQEFLLASEIRYRRLFESAKDGILILDADTGKIEDVNPYLIEMLGYSKEELVEKMVWEIGAFKDTIGNRSNFQKLMANGYIHYENLPLETKSGQQIEVEFVSNVYSADNKNVIQCTVRDITDRRKAEAAIRYERDTANMYLNIAGVIFVALDRKGVVTLINAKGCEILGLGKEDILGKNWMDRFIPKPLALEVKRVFNAMLAGDFKLMEYYDNPIVTADGEERLISWHNTILRDEAGDIIGMLSSGNDITDTKRAEEALKESEKKYSSYIEYAPDGVYITDESGHFLEANPAASDITGYSRDELLAMTTLDILAEASQKSGKNHLMKVFEKGSAEAELQYRRKNGSVRWLNVNAVKLTETRFLSFVKDITGRKRAENKLVYLSYHDQLTGLYNRRFFEEELKRLDTKRNMPLSVINGDINGLKFINDSFGHSTGDEYLKKAAEIIKKSCRADDIIARLGGDEFVILLPKADAVEAVKIINRILLRASTQTVSNFALSISFGYDTKTTEEQSLLEILANSESHMYRHKIYERTSIRSKTIDIIMDTLFLKSYRESQHSARVSMICESIASNMNFEKDDVNQIKIAGLIHDIGKIGIDEKILNKAGRLNNYEWEEMRKHPEAGWRILCSLKEFSELARFVLYHHEKFDGSGYPNGLQGEEIPIEARIITIADAYDAITSERSYRKGVSKEEAIAEIQRCSGTHFDPKIVDVLINKVLPDFV